MTKRTAWLVAGSISFLILLLTGLVAHSLTGIETLDNICMGFHLLPFGLLFSGASVLLAVLYYIVVWLLMSLFIKVFLPVRSTDDHVENN